MTMTNKSKYLVFHPDHEVQVQFLLSMRNAMSSENTERFAELFGKAGLLDKKADEWVPAQIMLDICNELEERGGPTDFVATGLHIAMEAQFPSEFTDLPIEQKLAIIGEGYPNYNRGTDIGYSKSELVDPQHLVFHLRTPWPDDMSIGVFTGVCRRFLPQGHDFEVYYDQQEPRLEEGGKETLVHIEWKPSSD